MARTHRTHSLVAIRAGEIAEMIDALQGECRKWCEIVSANNPPGQLLHADSDMVERCKEQFNKGAEVEDV